MLFEMKVRGLALDPVSNIPIVILKGVDTPKSLPIWIGIYEANAIISELEKIAPSRPMTHDLVKNIVQSMESSITRVVITDLVDNTFYANIEISSQGRKVLVDSRPSDAIAIALRTKAAIFVDEQVFEKAKQIDVSPEPDERKKWMDWLQNADPDDFGKYKM